MENGIRLLVVERGRSVAREVLDAARGPARFEAEFVDRAAGWRERLAAGAFEAVLVELEDEDGVLLGLFDAVRAAAPGAAIVVLTPDGSADAQGRAWVRAGAQDYLAKDEADGRLVRALWCAVVRQRRLNEVTAEAELKLVLEASRDVYWTARPDLSRFLYVSRGCEAIWGAPPHAIVGEPDFLLRSVHPDDRGRVEEAVSRQHAGGCEYDLELRIVRSGGGAPRRVRLRGHPVVESDGSISRVAGVASDVTERRLVEEALDESERCRRLKEQERDLLAAQLHALREMGNDALMLVAADGRIVRANDRALETYGYAEGELLQANVLDLDCEDPSRVVQRLAGVLAGERQRYDAVHRRRDGSRFPAEVSARALRLGAEWYVQCVVRDVTAERAARAASEYKATLLDVMSDAVIGVDAGGRITVWNRAAEELYGVTAGGAIGRRPEELGETRYDDGLSVEEQRRELEAHGRTRRLVKRRIRGGDWVESDTTIVAFRGPDGRVAGFVSVNRPLSAPARADQAPRAGEEPEATTSARDGQGRP